MHGNRGDGQSVPQKFPQMSGSKAEAKLVSKPVKNKPRDGQNGTQLLVKMIHKFGGSSGAAALVEGFEPEDDGHEDGGNDKQDGHFLEHSAGAGVGWRGRQGGAEGLVDGGGWMGHPAKPGEVGEEGGEREGGPEERSDRDPEQDSLPNACRMLHRPGG